ncbi:MAG: hypothetical protein Q9166_007979 [cf. Caloplaca sp. 2 TL-2023]
MTSYVAPTDIDNPQFPHLIPPALPPKPCVDSSRLAPEDAFFAQSPPRLLAEAKTNSRSDTGPSAISNGHVNPRKKREKDRGSSGSRRGKGEWKKLLWVKQPKYPDNYTDPPTFLSHLQRNPRLQPYDFWPLVADSTVIVQHLASVAIFVCCFIGINREQVSPVSVVSFGSASTILGWVLWDFWVGQSKAARMISRSTTAAGSDSRNDAYDHRSDQLVDSNSSRSPSRHGEPLGLGLTLAICNPVKKNDFTQSSITIATPSASSASSPPSLEPNEQTAAPSLGISQRYYPSTSILSQRNQQRLATVKSAILIYCVLHGLSPILKSLTMSTSKDSIWALSSILMGINILFFDYGGGVGVK